MSSDLVQTFLAALDDGARAAYAAVDTLDARLARMLQTGRDEWPTLPIAPEIFVTYVARRLAADREPVAALDAIRAADLYLACACAHGDESALALFESRYLSETNGALARMRLGRQGVEEVKQLVRQKLFVPSGERPGRIADYSGRGDLRRWVRSIAVRTALNQMRKGKREVLSAGDDGVLAGVSAGGDDPELAYMKERYKGEFRQAFLHALTTLDDRQQAVLRYHFVDGLTIDDIGAIYRIHRVTAYRWIDRARDRLVNATLRRLRSELAVDQPDLDSIMRLIRSQLHLSLHRFLGPRDED